MNNFIQQKRVLDQQKEAIQNEIVVLEDEFELVERQLQDFLIENDKHQLLGEISDRLNRLEALDAGRLFWADDYQSDAAVLILRRIEDTVKVYNTHLDRLHERKQGLQARIEDCQDALYELDDEALEIRQQEEDYHYEFVVDRDIEPQPHKPMVMPWHVQGDDERRFRLCLLASLILALLLGGVVPLWTLPEPDENQLVEIPERLAKLVMAKKAKPKPLPEPVAKKPDEKKKKESDPKQELAKKEPKPSAQEKKQARKKVERAGVLAFKDNFQDLIEDDLDKRLGQQTQLSTAGKKQNRSQRSLITASAKAGSDGINTAALSRNSGGVGGALEGVSFSRVSSAIGTEGDFAGEERPLSEGVGPSRTDEEIQIVFDRYKSALYRIYNRELRNNPALQGKMVLRITILPDGAVSQATVESSDMNSPSLSTKIVQRVKRFNFGAKAGVPTITIRYPIDFLPAA